MFLKYFTDSSREMGLYSHRNDFCVDEFGIDLGYFLHIYEFQETSLMSKAESLVIDGSYNIMGYFF